jgi:outer membrane protein insertion porin family
LAGNSHLHTKFQFFLVTGSILLLLMASCAVIPKNYPKNVPFVYEYKVNVEGNVAEETRADLIAGLENQLDDSIGVRTVRKFFYKGINRQVLDKPPVYNSSNADRSVVFMDALMTSLGYFYDSISYKADTAFIAPDQYRVNVTFKVIPGKLTTLDSISYRLDSPYHYTAQTELQSITITNKPGALIKKGDAFAKGKIGSELDRLVELYRNSGYLRFTRDEMIGLWDTLDLALLKPTLDPLEQLEFLQALQKRRENPTADIEVRLKPGVDSSQLVKYYVGRVNVLPEYGRDTTGLQRTETWIDTNTYVIEYYNRYKPKIFNDYVFLRNGDLYSQRRYQRTINKFNSVGAWKTVNIEARPRPGQDTVDFNIQLAPADKYLFSTNAEVSQNNNVVSGNLFGIGYNLNLQNRNFARGANQSNTNIRYGIELGNKFIQTQQFSIGHNIYFPRVVPAFRRLLPERWRDNLRTVFSFNAANTERRELYNLTTINGSWGYEYQRAVPGSNKTFFITAKLPNIEYSYITKRDSLNKLIQDNPSLNNIFTTGLVSSVAVSATQTYNWKRSQEIYAANLELSGLLSRFIPSRFLDSNLYQFIKFNVEYTTLFKLTKKTGFAIRFFGGIGYELPSTADPNKKNNLPFFKGYFAGGPNSMRAWRLRRLGPGSTVESFGQLPDRYGDVQLELNAEYRFTIANVGGVKIESALYTDIGNIWFLKKAAAPNNPEQVFNLSRLGKDIGIGLGTGLRLDFTFFLVRLDYAYKVKDPSPSPEKADSQNKLFYDWKLFNGQIQLGINYPFKL